MSISLTALALRYNVFWNCRLFVKPDQASWTDSQVTDELGILITPGLSGLTVFPATLANRIDPSPGLDRLPWLMHHAKFAIAASAASWIGADFSHWIL